ncbi:MAG: type II toxin-antitoxin system death-on-curing family toxin, partial [Caldilineaceae bacterium]
MNEPLWLTRQMIDAFHDLQLRRFGGQPGVRDENAIEAALARAQSKWHYGDERDIATLAAAYGFGLCQNHGFIDGNKRIGFVAMAVFLDINGWELSASEVEVVRVMLAVASGMLGEDALAAWVRDHLVREEP